MSDALRCYRALFRELMFEREAAGGELPEGQEASFVERLNDLWWQLSSGEQKQFESEMSSTAAPKAAKRLGLVDCEVGRGTATGPRRAA